jgi:precorrin-8X/cobalt-precorrin-8 methylmutase
VTTIDPLTDGAVIYAESFAIIRREADLTAVAADLESAVVRMIHACGMVDLVVDVDASPGVATIAVDALRSGAPILCDAQMVARGVTRKRLPADNDVLCTLSDPTVPERATAGATTRSAAAVDLWVDHLAGSVVAIGNAPTALFHLLDLLDSGAPRPAAVIGVPVGFVGAAESKQRLVESPTGIPYLTVHGRRGGSAIAAAAVNAFASDSER